MKLPLEATYRVGVGFIDMFHLDKFPRLKPTLSRTDDIETPFFVHILLNLS